MIKAKEEEYTSALPLVKKNPRLLLREANLYPKKSFGQNFLIEPHISLLMARECIPDPEVNMAHVIELGAGTGALTTHLLERASHVVAIERDRDLIPILKATFPEEIANGKLTCIEADAKSFDFHAQFSNVPSPRIICGNLPYQITGPLLTRLIELSSEIQRGVIMIQHEVALRLAAQPATKVYGALSIFVQAAFEVSYVKAIPRTCFFPSPKVDSAIVRLLPHPSPTKETRMFRMLVHAAFTARRKTLRNAWQNIASQDHLEKATAKAGCSLTARGETLSVTQFGTIADLLTQSERNETQ